MSEKSLKELIFEANDLPREELFIPEWDLTVYVRGLTAEEKDIFEMALFADKGKDEKVNYKNLRARLVTLSTVDLDGNRVFTEEDIGKVGKKSAKAIDRIFALAQKLSAMGVADVKELTKN